MFVLETTHTTNDEGVVVIEDPVENAENDVIEVAEKVAATQGSQEVEVKL